MSLKYDSLVVVVLVRGKVDFQNVGIIVKPSADCRSESVRSRSVAWLWGVTFEMTLWGFFGKFQHIMACHQKLILPEMNILHRD